MSTPHDYRRPDGFPELRSRGNSRPYIEPDYVASDADDQLPLLSTVGRGPRGHSVLVGSVTDDGDEFSYTLIDEEGKVLYQTPDLSAGTISVSSMPEEPVAGDKVEMLVTVSRGSVTKRYAVAIPSGATGSRIYVVQGNLQYGGEGHAYQTQVSRLMVYNAPQPSGWEEWPEPRVNDVALFRVDGMLCIGTIEAVQDGMVTFTSQTTIDPLSHLSIGANGNWVIDNVDTGVKAQGERGEQGPQGIPGPVGPQGPPDGLPARMSVGTVDEGASPAFSVRLVDETTNTYAVDVTLPRGADGKSINVNGGVYKVSDLPPFDDTPVNDAFIVNDYEESDDYRYDLYIRGREPVMAEDGGPWTVVEDWQGVHGYSMRVLVGHEISPDAPISIAKDQASAAFTPSIDILDGDIAYDGHTWASSGPPRTTPATTRSPTSRASWCPGTTYPTSRPTSSTTRTSRRPSTPRSRHVSRPTSHSSPRSTPRSLPASRPTSRSSPPCPASTRPWRPRRRPASRPCRQRPRRVRRPTRPSTTRSPRCPPTMTLTGRSPQPWPPRRRSDRSRTTSSRTA